MARATVTPGTLNLANQTQDLAALNTDLALANTQAEIFDIDALKAKQQSAAALSELLNNSIGDLSVQLGFAEGHPKRSPCMRRRGRLSPPWPAVISARGLWPAAPAR